MGYAGTLGALGSWEHTQRGIQEFQYLGLSRAIFTDQHVELSAKIEADFLEDREVVEFKSCDHESSLEEQTRW